MYCPFSGEPGDLATPLWTFYSARLSALSEVCLSSDIRQFVLVFDPSSSGPGFATQITACKLVISVDAAECDHTVCFTGGACMAKF